MDKDYESAKKVINRISDELRKKWDEIKWTAPESIGKKEVILEAVETHAKLQLIYKIIHEIEWERNNDVSKGK